MKKKLQEKLQRALLAAKGICEEAEQAGRDFTDEERVKVAGYLNEATAVKDELKKLEGDDEFRRQLEALGMLAEGAKGRENDAKGRESAKGRIRGWL